MCRVWATPGLVIPYFSSFDYHNTHHHHNLSSCKLHNFLRGLIFESDLGLSFLSETWNFVSSCYMSIESVNLSTPVYLKTPSTPVGSFSGGGSDSGPASEDLSTTRASP